MNGTISMRQQSLIITFFLSVILSLLIMMCISELYTNMCSDLCDCQKVICDFLLFETQNTNHVLEKEKRRGRKEVSYLSP